MAELKVLSAFLTFILISGEGFAQPCSLSNIKVSTKQKGMVQGKPEWEVVISNNCICSQSDVQVQCGDFASVATVDPAIFKPSRGGLCLVNNGQPIHSSSTITFKYASQTQLPLNPESSQVNCS